MRVCSSDVFESHREQFGLTRLANPLYPPLSLACQRAAFLYKCNRATFQALLHAPQQRRTNGPAELTVRGLIIGI